MKFDPALLFDRSPKTVAFGYFCLGASVVLFGDFATAVSGERPGDWAPTGSAGGIAFVGVSALVLYGATAHQHRRAEGARRELETSNQQFQVLSRVFRHNVRNDLNVIQGYADLLIDRVDDERSRECLETIRQTTDDVVAISEKLRVIESATPEAPTGRVDLVDAVREAADDVDGTDVTISVETPTEAWIRADRSVEYPIREVFENAVTHNEGVCRVDARIEKNGAATCLAVSDNGPGIPADERAVLQAETETPLSHASSIGLWLVKWMCETQGGTVDFETTDDGTTVRLRFESATGTVPESNHGTKAEGETEPKRATTSKRSTGPEHAAEPEKTSDNLN